MDPSIFNNSTLGSVAGTLVISDDLLYWTIIIGAVGVCGIISSLGIVANVINIIVFIQQGVLGDSSTVSLFGLAISDLMCEVTLLWLAVCYAILYAELTGLPFDPMSVLFLTAGRPHAMFTQTTRWITTFVSFERCICVLFPFKVKTMFSPHKTAVIIPSVCVFIFLCGHLPLYSNQYLRWQIDPTTNRTLLMTYQTESYLTALNVCSYFNAQVIQSLAFLGVLVFSQATAIRLNMSRKWRKSTAVSGNQSAVSSTGGDIPNQPVASTTSQRDIGTKDKGPVKMIRVICIIFLICYTPDFMIVSAERAKPEIRPGGQYHNLFFFLYTFSFILEAFNSSVNIVVYYRMSTRYRNEFRKLFGRTTA